MRTKVKIILRLVRSAQELASGLEQDTQYLTGMLAGLAMAEDHAEQYLGETAIKCEGKEPLTNEEEAIWNHLQKILRVSDEDFAGLTHEQKFSAARVIVRQGQDNIRHPVATGGEYLGISFGHIFIGIEKDGYAHS